MSTKTDGKEQTLKSVYKERPERRTEIPDREGYFSPEERVKLTEKGSHSTEVTLMPEAYVNKPKPKPVNTSRLQN